ncbi:MAG TPA: hypothetical protein VIG66_05680 [Noviherbaspirillum sp.]
MTSPSRPAIDSLGALRALLDMRTPVRAIVWQGRPAYGKLRMPLRTHERVLLGLTPLIRRWLAPGSAFTPRRYESDVPVEVQRLRAMQAQGWNVPRVLAAEEKVFVTEDVGPTLVALLSSEEDADVRTAWLLEAARELAAFHTAGQWHGAAQARNVVRTADGRLGRIDFETALDERLPLPLLQAFDAALFFTSIARTRDAGALPGIARAYVSGAPAEARLALQRGLPLLRRLAHSRLLRRLAPKEIERMRILASLNLA